MLAVTADPGAEFGDFAGNNRDACVFGGLDHAFGQSLYDIFIQGVDVKHVGQGHRFGSEPDGIVAQHGKKVVSHGVVFPRSFGKLDFGADAVTVEHQLEPPHRYRDDPVQAPLFQNLDNGGSSFSVGKRLIRRRRHDL